MIESIVLDILLLVMLLLMVAIGMYRGGLREAFSAAGVLLGVLVATEWSGSWGTWISGSTSLTEGGSRFIVATATMVLLTAGVGYAVGTSFGYRPGPGGRMFGGVLAAAATLVAMAYVLTWLREMLFDGIRPDVIERTYLARWLDGGAGSVLLLASGGVLLAAVFGSIVRERDADEAIETASLPVSGAPRRSAGSNVTFPEKVEPAAASTGQRTQPVRVRESKQWDDRTAALPSRSDRLWSTTWPGDGSSPPRPEQSQRTGEVGRARERRKQGHGPSGTDGRSTPRS